MFWKRKNKSSTDEMIKKATIVAKDKDSLKSRIYAKQILEGGERDESHRGVKACKREGHSS